MEVHFKPPSRSQAPMALCDNHRAVLENLWDLRNPAQPMRQGRSLCRPLLTPWIIRLKHPLAWPSRPITKLQATTSHAFESLRYSQAVFSQIRMLRLNFWRSEFSVLLNPRALSMLPDCQQNQARSSMSRTQENDVCPWNESES